MFYDSFSLQFSTKLADCPNWLTWQRNFRTFDWIDAVGDLETTNKEINHLLSLI